jgi:hypothetical protein
MRSSLSGASAAAVVVIVAACGSDTNNHDNIPADRFAAAYAQALCGSLTHCCTENGVSQNFQDCTSGWKAYVERILAGPSALTNYEPRKAADCVDKIREASAKSCAPVPGSISDARQTCAAIFIGKKPLGAPCSATGECAPSPSGKRVGCEAKPGTDADAGVLPLSIPIESIAIAIPVCVELGGSGAGLPCLPNPADTRGSCDTGLFCEPTKALCVPLGVIGAPCVPSSCVPGSTCAQSGPNQGLCIPTSPLGGPCAAAGDCDATTRCDVAAGKCVEKNLSGTSCTSDNDCTLGVCDAITHQCLKNSIATSATCNGRSE